MRKVLSLSFLQICIVFLLQRSKATKTLLDISAVGKGDEVGSSCGSYVPMGTDRRCKGLNAQL